MGFDITATQPPSTDWFWCTPIEVIFLKFLIFLCKQFFFSKKTWKFIFLHFSNLCRRLRAHIEFKRQSQISVRQRRIWGRNFKTKLVTFSVFSCFFRFSVRLCCMDKWIKMDGRKQENTEEVRSLVLKFLPQIHLCLTLICDCLLNSMWALVNNFHSNPTLKTHTPVHLI